MASVSLAELVRTRVDRLAFVRDAIRLGILNYSAFANYIKPDVEAEFGRKVTREAVVLAVKRYEGKIDEGVSSNRIIEVLKNCRFSLNSGMCDVALVRDKEVEAAIFGVMTEVDWDKGENFYVILSTSEVEVVLEEKRLAKLESSVSKKKIFDEMRGISTLEISEARTLNTRGFLYFLSGVLARNSLNILQMLSSHTEITFSMTDDDAVKAYNLLKNLQKSLRAGEGNQTVKKRFSGRSAAF